MGGLPGKALPSALTGNLRAQHTFTVSAAGALAPTPPLPGDPSAFDVDKLLDVLVYLEYRLG